MLNFAEWLLAEAPISRRGQMDFENPHEQGAIVDKPKRGDFMIDSPSLFFDSGKKGRSLRTVMSSLHRITSDQDLNGQYKVRRFLPSATYSNREQKAIDAGNHPTRDAEEIMYDVSWGFPEHERTFGNLKTPAKVWLRIPKDNARAQEKYMKQFTKFMAENDPAKAAAAEDKQKQDQIRIGGLLGDEEGARKQADMLRQKEIQGNLNAQRGGTIPRQIDPGEDSPAYINRVTPPAPQEAPPSPLDALFGPQKPAAQAATPNILPYRQVGKRPDIQPSGALRAAESVWYSNKLVGECTREVYPYFEA